MKGATKYRSIASLAPLLSLLLLNASCSSSLFKVSPASALPPLSPSAASANVGVVTFRAAPLLTDEETQELFESNLQLAGLLPVRLEVTHNGGNPIEIKKLKFRLHDASNSTWKLISAKAAISRILKANDVFAYNPNSRKTFEKEFRAYEFDLKTPFASAETKRHGILIFQTAKKEPVASPKDLTLTIEGLAQPVSLKLN
jgi:hypothetical protein